MSFRNRHSAAAVAVTLCGMTYHIGPRRPFRHFIRERMALRDIDQVRAAAMLETSEGTMSKLLSGKMRMTDKWLAGFAHILECEVSDLFIDPKRPTQNELLAGLGPEDRNEVADFIAFLKQKRAARGA